MKNPWIEFVKNLDETNLVLEEEKAVIESFNQNVKENYKIHTEILPSPFMGNVEVAPIMLLVLNPGYDPKEEEKEFYTKYKELVLSELTHNHYDKKLPLFCLDEKYKEDSPYWYNKLKKLHEKHGIKKVSNNVCLVQFFPYTTGKYKNIPSSLIKKDFDTDYLPSQLYNFWLVEKAIKRKSIIVLTRSKKLWFKAVPELEDYDKLIITKNPRNPSISIGNCPEGFAKIDEALTKLNFD
jgi:hypothetical protein